jgi:hypothetical protein
MGVVYEAEDTQLHQFVALKVLADELAALERFQRYTLNLHRKHRKRQSMTGIVNVGD